MNSQGPAHPLGALATPCAYLGHGSKTQDRLNSRRRYPLLTQLFACLRRYARQTQGSEDSEYMSTRECLWVWLERTRMHG